MIKKLLSVSDEVDKRLRKEQNQSAFVDALLHVYYELEPSGVARQSLAMEVAANLAAKFELQTETEGLPYPPPPTPPASTEEEIEEILVETNTEIPLAEPTTPLVNPPMEADIVTVSVEPCEHGITHPVICIDCI